MFVARTHRGPDGKVAARLLAVLLDSGRSSGLRRIYLGTTDKFLAAHRFYEKNEFRRVDERELPEGFPRMAVDTRFYGIDL